MFQVESVRWRMIVICTYTSAGTVWPLWRHLSTSLPAAWRVSLGEGEKVSHNLSR